MKYLLLKSTMKLEAVPKKLCNTFLRIKTHTASNLGDVKHELLKNGAIITSFNHTLVT